MENTELKPCPFCGEKPIIIDNYFFEMFFVACKNEKCGVRPSSESEQKGFRMAKKMQAIRRWNKRV